MKNVYFIGKMGSGKSTLATALAMNYHYKQIRFANAIYTLAYDYFKMDKKVKDRKLLQIMGTEVGRGINDNIWVNRVIEDVKIVTETAKRFDYPEINFVLDDCRFRNEFDRCKKLGFKMIKIYRDDNVPIIQSNDLSEIEQDTIKDNEFDFIIHNNGTLDDLDIKVNDILKKLGI